MKKIIKGNPKMLVGLTYGILIIIIGIVLMAYPAFGLIDPIYFISIVFYGVSFVSIITYFINRKENDYELLLISLANVLVASFLFLFQNGKVSFILGTGLLIYTLLNTIIKGYYVIKYKKENKYIWFIKSISCILVLFVGVLSIINLYCEMSVLTMMIGYYFVIYGIILLLEPMFEILVQSGYLKKIMKELSGSKE